MAELLIRRREMILPDNTPILPADYQRVEYIERPAGTATNGGVSDTKFVPSDSDTTIIKIGCMVTSQPGASYGYFFAGGKDPTGNSVGIGLNTNKAMTEIGLFGGSSCIVYPNGGSSIKNMRLDVVATRAPTYCSLVCNSASNRTDYTPRTVGKNIFLFGMYTNAYNYLMFGRIYYCIIENNGVVIRNFVPCRRISNGEKGFYETVEGRISSSAYYNVGPDVT